MFDFYPQQKLTILITNMNLHDNLMSSIGYRYTTILHRQLEIC
jgi:hypothetical protein